MEWILLVIGIVLVWEQWGILSAIADLVEQVNKMHRL
jgi:hypothetical protein